MIKIAFLLLPLIAYADIYFDRDPSKVTVEDLEAIESFDENALGVAERDLDKQVDPAKISNFIWRHRAFQDDFTRLSIDLEGEGGRRTARFDVNVDGSLFPNEYNYYRVGVNLKYNIYDDKTTKELHNKMLDYKSKIITAVQKYAKEKENLYILKEELELERLKQLRVKVMVKTAQKYLDERLKNIEAIMKIRHKILESHTSLETQKLELLNMVNTQFQKSLEELL